MGLCVPQESTPGSHATASRRYRRRLPLPTAAGLLRCCPSSFPLQVNKSLDKTFSSKQPADSVEPSFVTEAKLRWNVRACVCACEGRHCAASCCLASSQLPESIHPSQPLPLPLRLLLLLHLPQLSKWTPGSSSAGSQPAAEGGAPTSEAAARTSSTKRADKWSKEQKASKQRLAELVDQHKNRAPAHQQAQR